MLYLDSSALLKHYVRESETDSLNAKLAAEESAGHSLFTSAPTFAEVHHALANKLKDKTLSAVAFHQAKQNFAMDWMNQITVIELGPNILGFIPEIFERTLLKSSDAVHLASAFWIRDLFRLSSKYRPRGATVTFTTSHRSLVGPQRHPT